MHRKVGLPTLTQAVPDNAAYCFRLGNSYARLDQAALAVTAYQAALQRDPKIVPAWHNLGAVLLEESQAAFQRAAASAEPSDPLRQTSALLAARIGAVRDGESSTVLPAGGAPSAAGSSAAPPTTAADVPDQGGIGSPASSSAVAVPPPTARHSRAGANPVSLPVGTAPSANAAGPTGGQP